MSPNPSEASARETTTGANSDLGERVSGAARATDALSGTEATAGAPTIRFAPIDDGREEECQCARCGSSVTHDDCDNCVDGYSYHDCGEDTCCCLYPEDNVPCDICGGTGGWLVCLSSPEFCEDNPIPGRESVERGTFEWFDIPASLPDKPNGAQSRAANATP